MSPTRQRRPEGEVLERTRPSTAEPPQFKVLLHNDDYTTMEFVIEILEQLFNRSPAEAHRIMMQVHRAGLGVAGVFGHEEAETKVARVHERAREAGYPLRASLEAA